MRDCEVQTMRPGCLDITRSDDGLIDRYRVRSTAYKWKRAEGVPADWITIEPVAEAIRVLEHLSKEACAFHGVDTLWPVLDTARAGKPHVSAEIVRALNAFRDHVNAELVGKDRANAIPAMHEGTPFKTTTRQFRRTLGWHIANRPFVSSPPPTRPSHRPRFASRPNAPTPVSVPATCQLGRRLRRRSSLCSKTSVCQRRSAPRSRQNARAFAV